MGWQSSQPLSVSYTVSKAGGGQGGSTVTGKQVYRHTVTLSFPYSETAGPLNGSNNEEKGQLFGVSRPEKETAGQSGTKGLLDITALEQEAKELAKELNMVQPSNTVLRAGAITLEPEGGEPGNGQGIVQPIKSANGTKAIIQPSNPAISGNREEKYQPVTCQLLEHIEWYLDERRLTTHMFDEPHKYWRERELEKVKWASVRLRCLIENFIRFDSRVVSLDELKLANKSLVAMMKAKQYKTLPLNYPHTKDIALMQQWLAALIASYNNGENEDDGGGDGSEENTDCEQGSEDSEAGNDSDEDGEPVLFSLTVEDKGKLIAMRYQLAGLVPMVRFQNLDFTK
jgi:hypothetical protein